VPLSKRSQYIERMLAMPQEDGQCHIYKEEYPHDDYFTFQGRNLHYYYTSPHSKPKAVLFFFHGLNSHGGSSGYVGNTLAKLTETNVYAIDFLNFGKSIGCYKGYIESF
jgi:pimeloyl-ACP methyl ester carboxylesterase